MSYETILLDVQGRVGLITLNRPQALNALNAQLINELNQALDTLERNPEHRLHRADRLEKSLRRRRRHQGNGRADLPADLSRRPVQREPIAWPTVASRSSRPSTASPWAAAVSWR